MSNTPGKVGMLIENRKFMEEVGAAVQKLAPVYGIKVCSPIIAQAILESGWGSSNLAKNHHNYFGLTAGSSWTGKKVDLGNGRVFRSYDSVDDGMQGYFDVISQKRYDNLKGVTDPVVYIDNIIADGYCDDANYKKQLINLINGYNLTAYDTIPDTPNMPLMTAKNPTKDMAAEFLRMIADWIETGMD